jgi:hypothetical protein
MADISGSFRLEKMRSGNAALYQLREQFERFASAPQKVDVCESIARCFYQLEQYGEAGNWYEATGKIILSQPTSPSTVRALDALDEFERAADCYSKSEDDEKFTECSEMIRQLRRVCASS